MGSFLHETARHTWRVILRGGTGRLKAAREYRERAAGNPVAYFSRTTFWVRRTSPPTLRRMK